MPVKRCCTDDFVVLPTLRYRSILAASPTYTPNNRRLPESGTLRPSSGTGEFQRLRSRAGLTRIKLHGLRNTSVSLMLDQGISVQIDAA
jgi:hypothetical protein